MAVFGPINSLKLISRKIWVTDNWCNFHTVCNVKYCGHYFSPFSRKNSVKSMHLVLKVSKIFQFSGRVSWRLFKNISSWWHWRKSTKTHSCHGRVLEHWDRLLSSWKTVSRHWFQNRISCQQKRVWSGANFRR